jgi:HD superfamily phosphohydrolase YqeK
MANDIFISYRSADSLAVDCLYEALVTVGGYGPSQVFRDRTSVAAGQPWIHQIEDAVIRADAVLVVIGPHWEPKADESDWVTRELRAALQRIPPVPIIPIRLPGAEIPALPAGLEGLAAVQAVPVSNPPTRADIFAIGAALSRNGVRPINPLDPWEHAARFLPIDDFLERVWGVLDDGHGRPSVVLLTGAPGSGRSTLLKRLPTSNPILPTSKANHALVGLHDSLRSSLSHVCPVVDDWMSGIFEQAPLISPELLRDLGDRLATSKLARLADHLLPLGSIATVLPLEARFRLLRNASFERPRHPDRRGLDLPVPLVIDLLYDLAAAADCTGTRLLLAVDDFDSADPKSRDVVRELVRSAPDHARPPQLQVLLSTADPERAKRFLDLDEGSGLAVVRLDPQRDRFINLCIGLSEDDSTTDNALKNHLTSLESPFEIEILLRHLYRLGMIVKGADDCWRFCKDSSAQWPQIRDAVDATINQTFTAPIRKTLEEGAIVGMSFAVDLADRVSAPLVDDRERDELENTLGKQIRESDPDERIVRCRGASGRCMITLTSSVWWKHLQTHRDRMTVERQTLDLGERYAATAGDRYGDWITAAELLERVGENAKAAEAYLRAARLARDGLSINVAARRYRDAAASMSLAAIAGDEAGRSRALLVTAFALVQAARLRCRAADVGWPSLSVSESAGAPTVPNPEVTSRGYDERPAGNGPAAAAEDGPDLQAAVSEELDLAKHAMKELRHALARWPNTCEIPEIENLVLDLSDRYLSDHERITARYYSLWAHLGILLAWTLPIVSDSATSSPLEEEAERRYSGALRDAEQGLAGAVRRFLVVLASVGLAEALTTKAENLVLSGTETRAALDNLGTAALFHVCRARLILRRWSDTPADRMRALDLRDADDLVRSCLDRLAKVLSPTAPLRLNHVTSEGEAISVVDLVRSWSRALSPDAFDHASKVEKYAQKLNERWAKAHRKEFCHRDDITIVAYAHDLFRGVEPSRVLALFRELETSPLPDLTQSEAWIGSAEWTTPILLHGRLAALFLDLVLDAPNRLGSDRFAPIVRALGTHTTGQGEPPPLARLLFISDTHQILVRLTGEQWRERQREIECAAGEDPSLYCAYRLCLDARIALLDSIGRTPAVNTRRARDYFMSCPA